jgi:hypothetical protein
LLMSAIDDALHGRKTAIALTTACFRR